MKNVILFLLFAIPVAVKSQLVFSVSKDSTAKILSLLQQKSSFTISDTVRNTDRYYFVNLQSISKENMIVMVYYDQHSKIERVVIKGTNKVIADLFCKVSDTGMAPDILIKKGAYTKIINGEQSTFSRGNQNGDNASIIFRPD